MALKFAGPRLNKIGSGRRKFGAVERRGIRVAHQISIKVGVRIIAH